MAKVLREADVLLVCSGPCVGPLRTALAAIDVVYVTTPSHVAAVRQITQRSFTHVFFETGRTDMPPEEFIKETLAVQPEVTMIPLVEKPEIDHVFALLKAGAKGFLVYPFTVEVLEEVLLWATLYPPRDDVLMLSENRNGPLAAGIVQNLDRYAHARARLLKDPDDGDRETVYALEEDFRKALALGYYFCEGGPEVLRDEIAERCLYRARGGATRLGSLRNRLRQKRALGAEEKTDSETPPDEGE